jgi:hypothetical protein
MQHLADKQIGRTHALASVQRLLILKVVGSTNVGVPHDLDFREWLSTSDAFT